MTWNRSSLRRAFLATIAAAPAAAASAVAPNNDVRNYDAAVSCKALSEVASNAHDRASRIAIAHINKAIKKEIAAGATKDQTISDIEYARINWRALHDIATLQSEWRKCVNQWKD